MKPAPVGGREHNLLIQKNAIAGIGFPFPPPPV
jgi:hypothetical protein